MPGELVLWVLCSSPVSTMCLMWVLYRATIQWVQCEYCGLSCVLTVDGWKQSPTAVPAGPAASGRQPSRWECTTEHWGVLPTVQRLPRPATRGRVSTAFRVRKFYKELRGPSNSSTIATNRSHSVRLCLQTWRADQPGWNRPIKVPVRQGGAPCRHAAQPAGMPTRRSRRLRQRPGSYRRRFPHRSSAAGEWLRRSVPPMSRRRSAAARLRCCSATWRRRREAARRGSSGGRGGGVLRVVAPREQRATWHSGHRRSSVWRQPVGR